MSQWEEMMGGNGSAEELEWSEASLYVINELKSLKGSVGGIRDDMRSLKSSFDEHIRDDSKNQVNIFSSIEGLRSQLKVATALVGVIGGVGATVIAGLLLKFFGG